MPAGKTKRLQMTNCSATNARCESFDNILVSANQKKYAEYFKCNQSDIEFDGEPSMCMILTFGPYLVCS